MNNIFSKPGLTLRQRLLMHNEEQSRVYSSSEETMARRRYRGEHPTDIATTKCMDGRVNIPVITGIPPGIITPYRNLGGKFRVGWSYFGELLTNWVNHNVDAGRRCLILVTYHYSAGQKERGCWGFEYDRDAAIADTGDLKSRIENVWGSVRGGVVPIKVGVETDSDALIFHGSGDQILDLSKHVDEEEQELRIRIEQLYPNIHPEMVNDLLPLVMGNITHIKAVRESGRIAEDVVHGESVLAIGKGFDWLHEPNLALIVGPFSFNLTEPITSALHILQENLNEGRIPKKDGLVIMTSATFTDEAGPEKLLAIERARELLDLTMNIVKSDYPDLIEYITPLCGVTNMNTRYYTRISEN